MLKREDDMSAGDIRRNRLEGLINFDSIYRNNVFVWPGDRGVSVWLSSWPRRQSPIIKDRSARVISENNGGGYQSQEPLVGPTTILLGKKINKGEDRDNPTFKDEGNDTSKR